MLSSTRAADSGSDSAPPDTVRDGVTSASWVGVAVSVTRGSSVAVGEGDGVSVDVAGSCLVDIIVGVDVALASGVAVGVRVTATSEGVAVGVDVNVAVGGACVGGGADVFVGGPAVGVRVGTVCNRSLWFGIAQATGMLARAINATIRTPNNTFRQRRSGTANPPSTSN